ncbi:carbohydrate ABC transporter permease [Vallitalea okinawensis]|uniref:carbohydrate ABC transporter permease n=1 Tax=Vallitalea okinawensis TaxID=2078660 RepID=UPI000CFBC0ED|nr:carbohydrate ABC transporter permease [Vallitalea okinawensis]
MSKKKKIGIERKSFNIGMLFTYIVLYAFSITTIYPLIWVGQNSFKTSNDLIESSFTLPTSFMWDNFKNAITKINIFQGYANSLIISGTVVIVVIFFSALAAYILARFEFKGNKIIRSFILASMLVPVFATILPVFKILANVGLIDTHVGVILPQIAGNIPFAVILLTSFMETVPNELEEAAKVEGANVWKIFSKIFVPITKPALATSAIFTFLWSYNDLFTSLIIIRNPEKFPVNRLLTEISSQYGTDYGLLCAVIILIIGPVLSVYMIGQKQIVEGMTAGAVKG